MKITKHVRLYGRVQGVFFRESMHRKAEELGVAGWVRNRRDGSVEAMLHGTPEAVDAVVRWAETGPEMARVERVEVNPADGAYPDFQRRETV